MTFKLQVHTAAGVSLEIYPFTAMLFYPEGQILRRSAKSFFNDQSDTAETIGHSWKISSSLSLSFLVSLVIVRGTAPCGDCCCIVEDEMALCDLVSGRQSDVLLRQAASRAATL